MFDTVLLHAATNALEKKALPIRIESPDGALLYEGPAPVVNIKIKDFKQTLRCLARPSLSNIGKAYVEGWIDLDGDLPTILSIADHLTENQSHTRPTAKIVSYLRHTRRFDRRYVSYHYDTSNDFYRLWLESNMVYSCAYFKSPTDDLDTAQIQKLDHICQKLQLKPGERFLDIGCGWGALVRHAAKYYGVEAIGLTLSQNQFNYAKSRIEREGLTNQCTILYTDYRDMTEEARFDKIASVGMFEHVGRARLLEYFTKVQSLLKEGGLFLNHGITNSVVGQGGVGSGGGDFIDTYVFPGGELTHIAEVLERAGQANLETVDLESLRPHYSQTLWHWVQRLDAQKNKAIEIAGEKKYRIWRIYMAGCAHAFSRNWISVYQALIGKTDKKGRLNYPFRRDYMYCNDNTQKKIKSSGNF